ncbi:hypothetical protein [uncultured Citrobacter sp.]|uniref:hypothetical protein n=1 Tax=uncultured Citrobacter sp. TaxID=200446 RepID=UPI002595D901|nr:hypothetical protein [uncultured Citrobacter sp.]
MKGFTFIFPDINRKTYKIILRRIILYENLSIQYKSIGKYRKLSVANNFRRELPDNLHQKPICQYATTAPVRCHRLPAPVCRRLPVSGLHQILPDKHQTAPALRPFQPFGLFSLLAFSGLALLPLVALYLYLAFFLLLAQSSEKYRNAAPESC